MKLKAKTDCSLYALDRPVFVAIMKHETMMKNRLAFMRSVCLDGMPPLFDELADSEMMTWMLQFREQTVEPGYKFTSQVHTVASSSSCLVISWMRIGRIGTRLSEMR
jgi:hypothetical protein